MRVVMIGATGLVGRSLWPLVERDHDLLVLGRRPSGAGREKLGDIRDWPGLLAGERVDAACATFGTTIKKAGSRDRFVQVDRDAVLAFARAARAAGARHFLAIASAGANASSRNRYVRLKGEIEQQLQAIGFERLDIVRPGLLIGERPNDPRLMERLCILLDPFSRRVLRGSLARYAGIEARTVARAMAALLAHHEPGLFVHHNDEIRRLAGA